MSTTQSNHKRGLGRGLGALISSNTSEDLKTAMPFLTGRSVIQMDINKILPNPRQPRRRFDDEKLSELAQSIKEQGVTSPLLVRKKGEMFELIAGERRLRASKMVGLKTVPVIIKDFTDEQSLEIALVENLQREDLNAIEEAIAYKTLADEFNLTHEQIAQKVGKSRVAVTNALRLLELPEKIINSIFSGQITSGHARPILSIPDPDKQIEVLNEIIKNDLSVRDVESLVSIILSEKKLSDKEEIHIQKHKKRKIKEKDPTIRDIEEKMISHLGTKVEIHGTSQKGKIVIHYYSQEDLERILDEFLKE